MQKAVCEMCSMALHSDFANNKQKVPEWPHGSTLQVGDPPGIGLDVPCLTIFLTGLDHGLSRPLGLRALGGS